MTNAQRPINRRDTEEDANKFQTLEIHEAIGEV